MSGPSMTCNGACGGVPGVRVGPMKLFCTVCGGSGRVSYPPSAQEEYALIKASRGVRPAFMPPRPRRPSKGTRAAAKAAGIARARATKRARDEAEAAAIIARRPADYFSLLDTLKAQWKEGTRR